jgi:hypothetical protein
VPPLKGSKRGVTSRLPEKEASECSNFWKLETVGDEKVLRKREEDHELLTLSKEQVWSAGKGKIQGVAQLVVPRTEKKQNFPSLREP